MSFYLWQSENWPKFTFDRTVIEQLLAEVHFNNGKLIGIYETMGIDLRNRVTLTNMTADMVNSSEIEGVSLIPELVRSSIAKGLRIELEHLVKADRYTDGVVEIMLDAVQNYEQPLTHERLFNWHTLLFPKLRGKSLRHNLVVGNYRKGPEPMYVVSGAIGREKVHYEAPPAEQVPQLMEEFLVWVNREESMDGILKAAIAHLWFVSIHPFSDGNGRIARTITELLLCRNDHQHHRFYSFSSSIRQERKSYYAVLERTQHGKGNITEWLTWFLTCLLKAFQASLDNVTVLLQRNTFWEKCATVPLNERQRKILNMLWDDFEGKLNTSKWAKITKCSQATALRDIQDLLAKKLLKKTDEGGRNTNYELLR